MKKMQNDLRMALINKDGSAYLLFKGSNNNFYMEDDVDIEKIKEYYSTVEYEEIEEDSFANRHLFILKNFLKTHYVEEFKRIGVKPEVYNDDLTIYYFLSTIGVSLLINSSEHVNIAILSSNLTEEQKRRIESLRDLFSVESLWSIHDNFHLETFEEDDVTYHQINTGESIYGDYSVLVEKLEKGKAKK